MKYIRKTVIFILLISIFMLSAACEMPKVTNLFQLTKNITHESDASWSPDDTRIVYIREGLYGSELWVMNADGSNKTKYVQSTDWLGYPNWGLGGILYTSQYSFKRDRHWDIWIVDGEGLASKQLTYNKTDQKNARWNKNSTLILYLGRKDLDFEIWTMNPGASNLTRLTYFQTDLMTPSWSPDDTRIIYSKDNDIWVMDADATNQVQLTNDEFNQSYPTWSPDGRWIAYISDEDGDEDIWVMSSDGSEKMILINESRKQTSPEWSHDGTRLLYTSYQDVNGDIWAAAIHVEPPPTPTPTVFATQKIVDEETRQNVSRLTILGAAIVILMVLVMIFKIVKSMKE